MVDKKLIRIKNGFSDRNKISPYRLKMQYDDFDEETRIRLKNLSFKIIDNYINISGELGKKYVVQTFADEAFDIETRLNEYQYEYPQIEKRISLVFNAGTYDEVLSLVEFIANKLRYYSGRDHIGNSIYRTYYDDFNKLFEEEYVGYRFVDGIIVKITNNEEIEAINEASNSPYKSVKEHIDKAIKYISVTQNIDYKNSIKESITALEVLCSILTKKNAILSEAIKNIFKDKNIHPALKEAVIKLYGFSSDAAGIRHDTAKEETRVTFDEAKLILVICSGIINYLISIYKD